MYARLDIIKYRERKKDKQTKTSENDLMQYAKRNPQTELRLIFHCID